MVVLPVKVTTNAKKFSVSTGWSGELKVHLTCLPVKGKANQELIKQLSLLLDAKVELVSGEKSSRKKLSVEGLSLEEIKQRLKV
ncbi:DUF167 family protein [archaeon]|nr:DUF167 family protein [archaeon]